LFLQKIVADFSNRSPRMTFNASTPLSFILILNGHWISKGSPLSCPAAGWGETRAASPSSFDIRLASSSCHLSPTCAFTWNTHIKIKCTFLGGFEI
jgi:hypothetical protein